MVDIFQQFEQSAVAYHPMVLGVPGLVSVLLGIFLWLGGSLYARTSVGLVSGLFVAGVGIFFVKPLAAVGLGVMACLVTMMLKRLGTGVLASMLVTFFVFLSLCQYRADACVGEDGRPTALSSQQAIPAFEGGDGSGIPESFEHLKAMVAGVARSCVRVGQALDLKYQVVVGISAFFALLMGCVLQRLAETVACAFAGVLFLWGGMVLMLLSKGAQPLTGLLTRPGLYVAMMSAMIGVGILEQLLFCSKPMRKDKGGKPSSGKKGK